MFVVAMLVKAAPKASAVKLARAAKAALKAMLVKLAH